MSFASGILVGSFGLWCTVSSKLNTDTASKQTAGPMNADGTGAGYKRRCVYFGFYVFFGFYAFLVFASIIALPMFIIIRNSLRKICSGGAIPGSSRVCTRSRNIALERRIQWGDLGIFRHAG